MESMTHGFSDLIAQQNVSTLNTVNNMVRRAQRNLDYYMEVAYPRTAGLVPETSWLYSILGGKFISHCNSLSKATG